LCSDDVAGLARTDVCISANNDDARRSGVAVGQSDGKVDDLGAPATARKDGVSVVFGGKRGEDEGTIWRRLDLLGDIDAWGA